MATATEVIFSLKARGVTLQLDNAGGLRVHGASRLTDRERAALKAHKGAILKALAAGSAVSTTPASPASVAASTAVTEPLLQQGGIRQADITQLDTQADTTPILECSTCLRYGPNDRYCGHKLRVIRDGENVICAGKGYSPKGSP